MIVVNPILKRVVYPWLANSGYLRRRAHGGAFCVLTYHGIFPAGYASNDPHQDGCLVTAANFRAQLQLLKEIYHVVSPEEVHDWIEGGKELPERAVLLTCDDGLRNALTDMAPILQEEGLSCLFFVLGSSTSPGSKMLWYEELYLTILAAAGGSYSFDRLVPGFSYVDSQVVFRLGDRSQRRSAWWSLVKLLSQCNSDQRLHFLETSRVKFGLPVELLSQLGRNDAHSRRFELLNLEELRQLSEVGMSIGSHTLSHPILSEQSSELAWQEIFESRSLIEGAIGKPVWALAYPFGDETSVTAREMQMAEQAGYHCAFVNTGGGFGATLPRFGLPRVHVTADMTLSEFEAHVSGFHRDFRSRLAGDAS